jgi:FtsH-binding integral membrane protein
MILLFVIIIVLACCEGVRRKSPINFILLFIFTLCMSLMLGVTSAQFEVREVMLAVGITTVVTVGLTIFALQTKWDFTTMGGILFVFLIVFFIFGIFAAIFRDNRILTLVYACVGAMLFSFYLVYDIQLMMGGKHKYSISPEEYIFAALNLYTDIVNIFMYILMIISSARN